MVLEDHVRRGKKLVPPLMAGRLPLAEATKWHLVRLPEVFWLAMLASRLGNVAAMAVVAEMVGDIESSLRRIRQSDDIVRAYLMSEHYRLTEQERNQVADDVKNAPWLKCLKPHLCGMAEIWADVPTQYLAAKRRPTAARRTAMCREIKDLLQNTLDRHDRLSLVAQTIVLTTAFRLGHLNMATDLPFPNLEPLLNDRQTENANHAAGFAVAFFGSMIACGDPPDDFGWQRNFWNTCYRLQPCEFDYA